MASVTRVMIVGTPRSGTTLLQSLVSTHPRILSFPETHYFTGTSKIIHSEWAFFYRNPEQFMRKFFIGINSDIDIEEMPKYRIKLVSPIAKLSDEYICYFVRCLDWYLSCSQCDIWLEKTPRHLHYLSVLRKFINADQMQVLHVIRDHDPTVRSMVKASQHWNNRFNLDSASERWCEDIQLQFEFRNTPGHFFIKYESILTSFRELIPHLFNRLSLEYHSSYLDRRREESKKIINDFEHWKSRNHNHDVSESGVGLEDTGKLPVPSDQTTKMYRQLCELDFAYQL